MPLATDRREERREEESEERERRYSSRPPWRGASWVVGRVDIYLLNIIIIVAAEHHHMIDSILQ